MKLCMQQSGAVGRVATSMKEPDLCLSRSRTPIPDKVCSINFTCLCHHLTSESAEVIADE